MGARCARPSPTLHMRACQKRGASEPRRVPRLAAHALRCVHGDAAATLAALHAGRARPGRLDLPLLALLETVGLAVTGDQPIDLLLLATTKGDLQRYVPALLDDAAPLPLAGGPAELAQALGRRFATPAWALGGACAAGPLAVAEAARALRDGRAKRVLILGGERLAPFVDEGFAALGALDPVACRPFAAERAGLCLADGAAALLLDDQPGGLRVAGWGAGLDAHHLTGPDPTGGGLERALRAALNGRRPDLLVAHGTGTRANDDAEIQAYRRACPDIPITAWKGVIGHALGATGLIELAVAAELMSSSHAVPGIAHGDATRPLDLDLLPPGGRSAPAADPIWPRSLLSVNAGFGGLNGAVLLTRQVDSEPRTASRDLKEGCCGPSKADRMQTILQARIDLDHCGWRCDDGRHAAWQQAVPPGLLPRPGAREVLGRIDAGWGRLDQACRLLVAALLRLSDQEAIPADAALVLLCESGSAASDRDYERARRAGGAEPQRFVYTLPSMPIGEASIRTGLRGPGFALAGCDDLQARAQVVPGLLADGCPCVLLARLECDRPPQIAWAERWKAAER